MLLDNKSIKKITSATMLASKKNDSILFSISYKSAYSISNLINNNSFSNKIKIYFSLKNINLEILGIGSTIIVSEPLSAYEKISSITKKYIDNSIHIDNDTPAQPKFLMGFSFASQAQNSQWKDYNPGKIILPEIQSELIDGICYNTISIIIYPDTKYNQIAEKINHLYEISESPSLSDVTNNRNASLNIGSEGTTYKEYTDQVNNIISKIKTDDIDKGVISRYEHYLLDSKINLDQSLQKISDENKNLLIYYFKINGNEFIGLSPEKLLERNGMEISSSAVAGTKPTNTADNITDDDKIAIEHQIVVDYINSTLNKFSNIGYDKNPKVLELNNLQHLITPIRGILKNNFSTLQILSSIHPTPAVCGSPYEESLSLINNLEMFDRGWFTGPIGWLNFNDNGLFFVAIRCLLKIDRNVYLFAGAGITGDSDSDNEWEETQTKISSILDYIKL